MNKLINKVKVNQHKLKYQQSHKSKFYFTDAAFRNLTLHKK